jgi:hypothetical protein
MFRYCSSSGSLYSISSGALSAIEISLSRFCCPAFYLGTCAATIQKCVAILLVASTHILRIFFVSDAAAAENQHGWRVSIWSGAHVSLDGLDVWHISALASEGEKLKKML